MALSRTIQLSFWTDSKIIDDFTPEDRYFYLYLMTNPHTNLCGCYEISIKQMADELGYSRETVEKLIERMSTTHEVITYSNRTKELIILHWHRYNWTSSDKFVTALEREIEKVKDPQFKAYLYGLLSDEDTVSIPYQYCMDTSYNTIHYNTITQDADNNAEIKPKKATGKKRFSPPTVEDVLKYCEERKNKVNAEQFIDYYTARGWKTKGGATMVDWQAAVRTWERNEYGNAGRKPQQTQFSNFHQREYDYDALEKKLTGY